MKNPNSNIYLYAKDHYKTDDLFSDLQIILGERSNIEPCYISKKFFSICCPKTGGN